MILLLLKKNSSFKYLENVALNLLRMNVYGASNYVLVLKRTAFTRPKDNPHNLLITVNFINLNCVAKN